MAAKVFVGNLSWGTTDESLHQAFSQYGEISDCLVLKDRETGRSRGFGFVTFADENQAQSAIQAMNDQDLDGRNIRVNLANERPAGGNGGGFRGGRGGFRSNNYGGQQGGYNGGYQQQGGYNGGY
ncbi:uncharacterized protein EV422DRAFT_584172 [Fimicolochytrium jonesii]|uniref:uncharacterized protein n=1 Tax=Fimicolochytrium jonesii TaxID=1396493 RepID=UPI0022FE89BA|nr:uncharacterized protein EV422DRAFT_584172 [Fimicolochytrium jonesii]KAI8825291.1 hypothetical protein EV422DRAFT_584172 [Fimicolochytrium jonesii]